jgi:P4 family phage/plasmid primase-like protien
MTGNIDIVREILARGDYVVPHAEDGESAPGLRDVADPTTSTASDLSHDALALDLESNGWSGEARHVAAWNKWLFWDGARWRADDRHEDYTRVREYLRSRAADIEMWSDNAAAKADRSKPGSGDRLRAWGRDQARTLKSKHTVAAVEILARSNAKLAAGPHDFDQDLMLLGTPGGTVDLRNGLLRPARRDDMITRQTNVTPARGEPSRFMLFLHEIFDGDADVIAFMQRFVGYALTGETREHKMLFFYGSGRNGKSVFLSILFHILGEYARRASAGTFLNTHGEKHPTDLAGLQGARLVIGSELPKGKTWDESTIKDLTGGDVITARKMRGDFFDFTPQLKLLIAGNNMPSFRGVDEAIRARVVLVPFKVTIPAENRDQHLLDKLKAEAPQILQWAIEGAAMWSQYGLIVPDRIAAASAEYFDQEDTLGQFLNDETEAVVGHFIPAQDIHQRFTQWCEGQGLTAWTQNTLVKELVGRGFERAKRMSKRGMKGLKLK